MRIVTDIFAWCRTEIPNWNPISISGYHIREAGSTEVQEVAFTLADGIAYVEAAVASGQAVDDFAPQLSFFFNAHNESLAQSREIPRGAAAVGAHHARPFRREGPALADAALPRADGRLFAHRAATGKQYRARGDSGAGRGARRVPVASRQRPRRSARAAHRRSRDARAPHPANHRARNRRREHRRSRSPDRYAVETLTE